MQLFMFVDPREWANKLATVDEDRFMDEFYDDDDVERERPSYVTVADLLELCNEDDQPSPDYETTLWDDVDEHGVKRPVLVGRVSDFPYIEHAGPNELALVDGHHRFTAAHNRGQLLPVLWTDSPTEQRESVNDNWHS